MSEPSVQIPRADDHCGWERLWQGYLRFYRARLDPQITETTYARLIATEE